MGLTSTMVEVILSKTTSAKFFLPVPSHQPRFFHSSKLTTFYVQFLRLQCTKWTLIFSACMYIQTFCTKLLHTHYISQEIHHTSKYHTPKWTLFYFFPLYCVRTHTFTKILRTYSIQQRNYFLRFSTSKKHFFLSSEPFKFLLHLFSLKKSYSAL